MRKVVLMTAVACAITAPTALAGSPTSSAKFWQNRAHSATCGKRIDQKTFQLLCSAKGTPRPTTGNQGGDPFVVLRRRGKPELVLLTQREFPTGNPKTLPNGSIWEKHGITCTVAHKVTCTNESGHGFTIGKGKYRSF